MSIRDEIKARCSEGRLFFLSPLIPSTQVVREMFISEEIIGVFEAPATSTQDGQRFASLRAYLDTFVAGIRISVADDPYKKPKWTFMARLDPRTDEVFDIRVRYPKKGIRVFGRFAYKDCFVALNWDFREELDDDKKWRDG